MLFPNGIGAKTGTAREIHGDQRGVPSKGRGAGLHSTPWTIKS